MAEDYEYEYENEFAGEDVISVSEAVLVVFSEN